MMNSTHEQIEARLRRGDLTLTPDIIQAHCSVCFQNAMIRLVETFLGQEPIAKNPFSDLMNFALKRLAYAENPKTEVFHTYDGFYLRYVLDNFGYITFSRKKDVMTNEWSRGIHFSTLSSLSPKYNQCSYVYFPNQESPLSRTINEGELASYISQISTSFELNISSKELFTNADFSLYLYYPVDNPPPA